MNAQKLNEITDITSAKNHIETNEPQLPVLAEIKSAKCKDCDSNKTRLIAGISEMSFIFDKNGLLVRQPPVNGSRWKVAPQSIYNISLHLGPSYNPGWSSRGASNL